MNILPFVSAFIILFAIGSYTVIHQFRAAVQETMHYSDSIQIQRQIGKRIYKNLYKSIPGKDPFPEETAKREASKEPKKDPEYRSPRELENIVQESKLNITPLFQENINAQLKKVTLNLLGLMYGYTDLYEEGLEEEILKVIQSTMKENPTIDSFEKLLPKIPEEKQELFYKLVKGTNNYKLREFRGYPALGDFLSIIPKERTRPILFSYASLEVLKAQFGTRLTHLIYLKEQEKWQETKEKLSLTKKELEELLLEQGINIGDFQQMLLFGHQKKSDKEFEKTANSKIRLRVSHPITLVEESPEKAAPQANTTQGQNQTYPMGQSVSR